MNKHSGHGGPFGPSNSRGGHGRPPLGRSQSLVPTGRTDLIGQGGQGFDPRLILAQLDQPPPASSPRGPRWPSLPALLVLFVIGVVVAQLVLPAEHKPLWILGENIAAYQTKLAEAELWRAAELANVQLQERALMADLQLKQQRLAALQGQIASRKSEIAADEAQWKGRCAMAGVIPVLRELCDQMSRDYHREAHAGIDAHLATLEHEAAKLLADIQAGERRIQRQPRALRE